MSNDISQVEEDKCGVISLLLRCQLEEQRGAVVTRGKRRGTWDAVVKGHRNSVDRKSSSGNLLMDTTVVHNNVVCTQKLLRR